MGSEMHAVCDVHSKWNFLKIAQSQEHFPPPQSMGPPCWQRCPGSINWQNPVSGCPPLLTRTGRCSPAGCPPKLQACPHPVALAGRLAGDLEQHTRCYCWGCRPAAAACATQRCPPMWLTKAAGGLSLGCPCPTAWKCCVPMQRWQPTGRARPDPAPPPGARLPIPESLGSVAQARWLADRWPAAASGRTSCPASRTILGPRCSPGLARAWRCPKCAGL